MKNLLLVLSIIFMTSTAFSARELVMTDAVPEGYCLSKIDEEIKCELSGGKSAIFSTDTHGSAYCYFEYTLINKTNPNDVKYMIEEQSVTRSGHAGWANVITLGALDMALVEGQKVASAKRAREILAPKFERIHDFMCE